MEKILEQVAQQVPSLAVLVVLVTVFLRRMRESDETQKSIAAECHATSKETNRAMDRNTEAFGRVSEALERVERRLDDSG